MPADATTPRATATSRRARNLARGGVVMLTILLYYAIPIWGMHLLNPTLGGSLWELFTAPFWMPVLYTVVNPWNAVPFVLFTILYVVATSAWAQVLVRRGRHTLVSAAAAILSMSVAAVIATLARDDSFQQIFGGPAPAVVVFTIAAGLAPLIVSRFFPRRQRSTSQH